MKDDRLRCCQYPILWLLFFLSPLLWNLLVVSVALLSPGSMFDTSLRQGPYQYPIECYFCIVLPTCLLFILFIIFSRAYIFGYRTTFGTIIIGIIALLFLSTIMFTPIIWVTALVYFILSAILGGEGVIAFVLAMVALGLLVPPATAVVLIIKR